MSLVLGRHELSEQLNEVSFSDLLSGSTVHFKKGLVLSSFLALVVGSLAVRLESFLGFRISTGAVSTEVLAGALSLVVIYYLFSYGLGLIVDLAAWDFRRERIVAQQYLALIVRLEDEVKTTFSSLESLHTNIQSIYSKASYLKTRRDPPDDGLSQDVIMLRNDFDQFSKSFVPQLLEGEQLIRSIRKVNLRLGLKIVNITTMDILFPMGFALLALTKTFDDIRAVLPLVL